MTGSPTGERRATEPLPRALAAALAERPDLSMRALARAVGVSPGHLSRVIRGADDKRASLELLDRLARELNLPSDYFIETRTAAVIAALEADARLADRVYREACNSKADNDALERPSG